ncbi:hypothetical protein C8R42DRAFT_723264 [Lentinula raphanica]|nr:hypothetical protein C8R42DRAFT_723264 [Lentinula raphanica]
MSLPLLPPPSLGRFNARHTQNYRGDVKIAKETSLLSNVGEGSRRGIEGGNEEHTSWMDGRVNQRPPKTRLRINQQMQKTPALSMLPPRYMRASYQLYPFPPQAQLSTEASNRLSSSSTCVYLLIILIPISPGKISHDQTAGVGRGRGKWRR